MLLSRHTKRREFILLLGGATARAMVHGHSANAGGVNTFRAARSTVL
jgi:hypothetical protein